MFPQVAPKFFQSRSQGPKNVCAEAAKPAVTVAAPAPKDTGTGPVMSTITYDVKLNGKSHRLTVTPAA
jgi:methylmalonyl-CoA carboxyltransferase 5S subunit